MRLFNRARTNFNQASRGKKIGLIVGLIFVITIGSLATWFGTTIYGAKNKIFTASNGGSILLHENSDNVKPSQLDGEGSGRINILLIGIDQAANLADVQQVLSIDTVNHKAALLSIPRDLWVTIPGYGANKINADYALAERAKKGSGPASAVATVSKLLDLPINYYIRINFKGLQQVVDAVGGVTIDVKNTFTDYQYPNSTNGYLPPQKFVQGVQRMDGTKALIYARSRHSVDNGEGSDFARSARQQKVLLALKDEMTKAGFYTNPLKITQVISALGDNVQTDLQPGELQQLAKVVKDFDTSQVITKVLDTGADGPLTGGEFDSRGYIIVSRDGDTTYKAVQSIAHELFTDPYLAKEKSTIEVRNATNKTGLGTTVTALLKSYGYTVTKTINNPAQEAFTQLIDYTGGKRPFTQSFLEKRFALKARQGTKDATVTTDFVLVIGADYTATAK